MIKYKINDRILIGELARFFQDWKAPPSSKIRTNLLAGSDLIITARERQ